MAVLQSQNAAKYAKWLAIMVIWIPLVYTFLSLYCCNEKPLFVVPEVQAGPYKETPQNTSYVMSPEPTRKIKLTPKQHVYYLKTHKTGSTTMYSILAEYCRSRDLLPLLPSGFAHINNRPPFSSYQVMLDPKVTKYDMVFNHHVYTDAIFSYLHNDTFRFTTIREPFKQFVSSFQYFRNTDNFPYLMRVNASDPLSEFLAHRQKYEVRGYSSYTNNRQSIDLGYSLKHSFNDLEYIRAFIAQTEQRFDLILITEYFHESLVLLKRTLNWDTGDILYYKKLARHEKKEENRTKIAIQRKQHQTFSRADVELYEHFLPIFKGKMSMERDLSGEVTEFEDILEKVHTFCDAEDVQEKQLIIPAGRWSDEIHMLRSKCKWLKVNEVSFTHHLQKVQKQLLQV